MSAVLGDTTQVCRLRKACGMPRGGACAATMWASSAWWWWRLFVAMIVLSALGLVAGGWQREVGVPNAPPTFIGPTAGRSHRRHRSAQGAERRPVGGGPAGAALQGMGRARGEVPHRRIRQAGNAADGCRPAGPRRAVQGHQGHRDLGLRRCAGGAGGHADRHRAGRAGRLLRRQGRRPAGVAVQRLHLDPRHPADLRLRRGVRPRHRHGGADPRADRLDRHLPPGARRIPETRDARIRARRTGHRRQHHRAACSATSCRTSAM